MAKNLTDIYVGVNKASEDRHENDFYPTPPLATYVLWKTLGERLPSLILEPCAGRGHISAELMRSGREVLSYDLNEYPDPLVPIHTGVDATKLSLHGHLYGVVTNPPYHKNLPHVLTKKFITDGYDLVAMFVRLTFLEGKRRKKLFTDHPPSDIIFLSDRINFGPAEQRSGRPQLAEMKDQIGGMIAYMWIIWDRNAPHENTKCEWALLEDYYPGWAENYSRTNSAEYVKTYRGHKVDGINTGTILDFMDEGE